MLKEAHIAPTGGNILAFFMRDVEGWREYGLQKSTGDLLQILNQLMFQV